MTLYGNLQLVLSKKIRIGDAKCHIYYSLSIVNLFSKPKGPLMFIYLYFKIILEQADELEYWTKKNK